MTAAAEPELPQRICHGCGQTDDHPRLHDTGPDPLDPTTDRLYHYDCAPFYLRQLHPSPAYEATAKGLRGDDVRQVVVKHAAKLAKEA